MAQEFHSLKVEKITKETSESVSIYLSIPDALEDKFSYESGQYITLEHSENNDTIRRSYSLSSSPKDEFFRFSVKMLPNGKLSPFLVQNLKVGDNLLVSPPEGNFTLKPAQDKNICYFLFGAGSGITPLMSHIRYLLEEEAKARVVLLYGSRNENQIIFYNELEDLSSRYKGQFFVYHTISQPTLTKKSGISGLLGMKSSNWKGMKGRIDRLKSYHILDEHLSYTTDHIFMICGPNKMMNNIEHNLKSRGIPSNQIHREYFTSRGLENSYNSIISNAKLQYKLDNKEGEIMFLPDKSLLDSMLAAKLNPPYSCTSGACSTCVAKLVEGKIHMEVCLALDEEELNNNLVLTCQCYPLTETVKVDFDF